MKRAALILTVIGFINVGCVFNNPLSEEISEIESRLVTDPRSGLGVEVNTKSFRVGGIIYANKINEELESFK